MLIRSQFTPDGIKSHALLGDRELAFMWDTAATHTFVREDRAPTGETLVLPTAGGTTYELVATRAKLEGLPADGLIGMPFFSEHVVAFDFDAEATFVE